MVKLMATQPVKITAIDLSGSSIVTAKKVVEEKAGRADKVWFSQANVLALRIQDVLAAPFSIGGREVFTSVSIGIACCRAEHSSAQEIMRDADTAMYHAKSRGKARHELFDAELHARARTRLELENDLRHAITNNDFEVHYQPIVLLSSGMCVGGRT